MGLHLIHGDNQFLSHQYFQKLIDSHKKQGFEDITRAEGKKVTLEEIIQGVESQSFFATNRLVVINNLLSSQKSIRQSEILDYLKDLDPKDSHVLLWESKTVTPAKLKKLSQFTPQLFKSSPVIFKFLDSLHPGNQSQFLKLYSQACDQDSAEFVFYMLIKRIRQLIQSTGDSLKAAPWQIARLKQQYQKFSPEGLLNFHHQVYLLDSHLKVGLTPLPLQSELEMILVNI